MLEGIDPQLDAHPGLADWWTRAEVVWDDNKGDNNLTLMEQIDFRNKISLQFPMSRNRVLYTKSGQYLAAARLDDTDGVVDQSLYWANASSLEEARYLSAILNSPAVTKLLAPMQSRGEHNPRHFAKLIWNLPIPLFDPADDVHQQLVELAAQAEALAAATDVTGKRTFQAQRRLIREALERVGIADAIDALVLRLLSAE